MGIAIRDMEIMQDVMHKKELSFNNLKMLELGRPIETSLVGSFDSNGRGSRRDIDLPLHRDGDYSTEYKNKIDVVGLYCIRPGFSKTIIEYKDKELFEIVLKKGQALIFDNKICRHGRVGLVKDRLLLRIWVSIVYEEDLEVMNESG